MKNKTLKLTYFMLFISFLTVIFFLIFLIVSLIIIKEISPIIISIIFIVLLTLLIMHYVKCIKTQKNTDCFDSKTINKLKKTNRILAFLFGYCAFCMILVFLYSIALLKSFEYYMIYFLSVSLINFLYMINLLLINKKI